LPEIGDSLKPEEIKRVREKLNLKQHQLAELLGLASNTAVSNIETGFRKPNKLAAAFLRLLDSLPSKKAHELMDLFRKYMEK